MGNRKYGVVVFRDGKESSIHIYSTKEKAEKHAENVDKEHVTVKNLKGVFVDIIVDNSEDSSMETVKLRWRNEAVKKAHSIGLSDYQTGIIFGIKPATVRYILNGGKN